MRKLADLDPKSCRDVLAIMGDMEESARLHVQRLEKSIACIEETVDDKVQFAIKESIRTTVEQLEALRRKSDDAIDDMQNTCVTMTREVQELRDDRKKCVDELLTGVRGEMRDAVTHMLHESHTMEQLQQLQSKMAKLERNNRWTRPRSVQREEHHREEEAFQSVVAGTCAGTAGIGNVGGVDRSPVLKKVKFLTADGECRKVWLSGDAQLQHIAETYGPLQCSQAGFG